MNYYDLLNNLKKDFFHELIDVDIYLKKTKILGKTFMITLPFSKNIYYNEKIIKLCSKPALKAVLIHELYHIVQFKEMNFFQKIIFLPRYHFLNRFRINHELECHREVVKRGFGKELLELNRFVKERYSNKIWNNKISDYYLSDKEIKDLMKNLEQ